MFRKAYVRVRVNVFLSARNFQTSNPEKEAMLSTFPITIHSTDISRVRSQLNAGGIKVAVSAIGSVTAHVCASSRDNALTRVLSVLKTR